MGPSVFLRRVFAAAFFIVFMGFGTGSALGQQVGYSVLTQRQGSRLPVASALFSLRVGGTLITEAGVQAVAPIRSGRVFVDERSTQTGVALANPSDQAVMATLILRNATGGMISANPLTIPARRQVAQYANQLATLPAGFVGSLTFECQGSGRLAAVTIRQGQNATGLATFATLPVADLDQPGSGGSFVFPHLGAGGIVSSQVILINPVNRRVTGRIQLFGQDGTPLTLRLDGRSGSEFAFDLAPDGVFQGTLSNTGAAVAGYALVSVDSGGATPAGTALFQFRDAAGRLDSEAGVGAIPSTTLARIFVDIDQTDTGVAIANTAASQVTVTLELLDRNGLPIRSTQRNIQARGQLALFATELFGALPTGFTGLLEIRASTAVVPIALKFTQAGPGVAGNILTTLPVADLTRPPTEATLVFPQVGFEGGLETRLIFINTDRQSVSRVQLTFTGQNGSPLPVPVTGTTASQFNLDFVAGGGGRLRPGNTASIAEILPDAFDEFATEISVARGQTTVVRPLVVDTEGLVRDDFPLMFSSLATDVATVDSLGRVTGRRDGFATLTISSGGVVVHTTTVSVVAVVSGAAGFEITGIARDLARRVYMADSSRHTLLLSQSLQAAPQRLAGMLDTPGFRDDPALTALFRNPAFLAFNQVDAAVYVSDSQNHVIRVVRGGRVTTFAGAGGQAGSADGTLAQARFRNPQGLALDERGFLWVVDSGNHTIRRIDLMNGTVSTVAGQAGAAGSRNGRGSAARFSGPVGIAVEVEPVGSQLARQLGGSPPPPVSVIVADTGNDQLRRVLDDGTVTTVVVRAAPDLGVRPAGRLGVASARAFNGPRGVAVDAAGNIYVSEPASNRVRTVLRNGSIAPAGPSDMFDSPQGIAVTGAGEVLVADGARVGRQIGYGAPEIASISPSQISVSRATAMVITGGNFAPESLVVVGDRVLTDIRVVNTRRIEFTAPAGLASGEITVTVQHRGGLAQTALRIAPVPLAGLATGRVTTVAGGSTYVGDGLPASAAYLTRPALTAVDSMGNIFIADALGNRIRRVDAMSGVVTTVAGTGRLGYLGDGQLAVTAEMGLPIGVAVDDAGNVYIADSINLLVRRVDSQTGIITTYAGNGDYGFSGDGGPATEASLSRPLGLAVDAEGNLFIADSEVVPGEAGNSRIRRVDVRTGVITTVAGNGTAGFSGDGGPAANAALNAPGGIAFDVEGNLYIADVQNHRVRRIDAVNGRIDPTDRIRTVAGNGIPGFSGDGGSALSASLNEPATVAADLFGNVYISDAVNNRIRRVDAAGRISTFAGNGMAGFSGDGGPAAQARLNSPIGVSTDGGGNVYIAEFFSNRVRRVDSMTGIIRTVAGNGQTGPLGDNGPAVFAGLGIPQGIAFDPQGNLVVADYFGSVIRRIDAAGTIRSVAGDGNLDNTGDGGPALQASLLLPSSVAVDAAGNIYIADQGNNRIRRVDAATGRITALAGTGVQGYSGDGGPALEAMLNTPTRLIVDPFGSLFVTDSGNNRVRRIDLNSGFIETVAGNGDVNLDCFFGQPPPENVPATEVALGSADGLALDGGNNLLIAETLCNRIRSVNRNTREISTVVGNGCNPILAFLEGQECPPFEGLPASQVSLFFPSGLSFDGAGNLFISDLFRVVRVDGQSAQVARVSGGGIGFSGDGGAATNAAFFYPRDLAVSNNGTLYVADSVNGRIRAIPGVAAPPARLQTLFFDNIEDLNAVAQNWLTRGNNGGAVWVITEDRFASPTHSLFGASVEAASDSELFTANSVLIPQNALTVGLSFQHYFDLEEGFDGGVVEISSDGGNTWSDAGPYFVAGGYNGTLSTQFGNPLGGRAAFTGTSGGGFASELDLRSFRGRRIQIRFRLGCDQSVAEEGWYVDDVRISAFVN